MVLVVLLIAQLAFELAVSLATMTCCLPTLLCVCVADFFQPVVEPGSAQVAEWASRQRGTAVGVYIHTGFISAMPQTLRNLLLKVQCSPRLSVT